MPDWVPPEAAKSIGKTSEWVPPEARKTAAVTPEGVDPSLSSPMADQRPLPAAGEYPRGDIPGDIARSASASGQAFISDTENAFPASETKLAEQHKHREDYGIVGGFGADVVSDVKRMGSALKVPFDAAGATIGALSMGTLHGTIGSAMSYFWPGRTIDEKKMAADAALDAAMMGLAPAKGGIRPVPRLTIAESDALRRKESEAALTNKAKAIVEKKVKAEGLSAIDIMNEQQKARASGGNIAVMDMGEGLQRLTKDIKTAGSKVATDLKNYLRDRLIDAGPYLKGKLNELASGSLYETTQGLFKKRSESAAPLFQEAFRSESMAPFEHQLGVHFEQARDAEAVAQQELTSALTKLHDARNTIVPETITTPTGQTHAKTLSTSAPSNDLIRATEAEVARAQTKAANATAFKNEINSVLERARADRTNEVPGATWSPRLQQFRADPDVKAAFVRALKLEKKHALHENRPFVESDYSIIGYDENSDPIVGTVPTMKAWAKAKEGLDAAIQDQVHKDGPSMGRPTPEGYINRKLRDDLMAELRYVNPAYGTAVDTWGGDSASISAIHDGQNHFTRPETNDQILAEFNKLSESDKEIYRLGAAQTKLDQLGKVTGKLDTSSGDAATLGNKAGRMVKTDQDVERFKMLFKTPEEAQNFFNSVVRERTKFETAQKASNLPGDEDEAAMQRTARAVAGTLFQAVRAHHTGNIFGVGRDLINLKHDLGLINNPLLNEKVFEILKNEGIDIDAFTKEPLDRPGKISTGVSTSIGASGLNDLLQNAQEDNK